VTNVVERSVGYQYSHFDMGATERAKRIDSYLTSERNMTIRVSLI